MSALEVIQGGRRPVTPRKGCILLVQGPRVKRIRDLGWLLRRSSQVEYFEVGARVGGEVPVFSRSARSSDAVLRAHMMDGTLFYTVWTSRDRLACWLDRPMFEGKRVIWFGTERRVGTALCLEEGL